MRRFQSHKVVEAAKIVALDTTPGFERVMDEEGEWHCIGHMPQDILPGWYVVRYSDGYISASPPEPFEDGYTELPQG